MENRKLPRREEIAENLKWNLEDIYESTADWERDFSELKVKASEIASLADQFTASAATMLQVLSLQDVVGRLLDKLYVYARMRKDENNANATYQSLAGRIQSLAVEASSYVAFIVPALSALSETQYNEYVKQEPKLELYRFMLSEIWRQKEHIRSASEEKLLAESGEIGGTANEIFRMFDNADIRFPDIVDENGQKVQLTKGRYSQFLESSDRRVRREAFEKLYETYGSFRNTLGAMLNGSIKSDVFYAKAHNFDSALEASLDDDNISTEVYDNLIETVHQFLPALNRYSKLRKKMLNLSELHMYDLYTPLVPEYKKKIDYSEAQATVLEGLKPLGEEYLATVREAYRDGWIDVCENEGKTGGAYAWGAYDTHPYILLNYQGKIHDVFTLAHEMGHAMHSYYSHSSQPYVYADYKIFVAEVASTVNEALLMEYMLAKATDTKEKMYLINQRLEQFRTTLFRQTMFAEFEKIAHAAEESGEGLTAEWFSEKYKALNELYYGAETVIDEEIAMEWARIPHFYTAFYVYKYATGYSAATALSKKLLTEGEKARQAYLEFLHGGGSDYPLNLLRHAGVDMESPEPVRLALEVFEKLVDELEKLL